MGLIPSTFSFSFGIAVGVYVAQNYNIPDIKGLMRQGVKVAGSIERAARKDQ